MSQGWYWPAVWWGQNPGCPRVVLACWWAGQVLTWLAAVVPGLEPTHWWPRPVLQQLPVGVLGIRGLVPPTGRWIWVPGSLVVGPWWSQSWCQPSGGLGQSPGGSGSDASLLIRALSPDNSWLCPRWSHGWYLPTGGWDQVQHCWDLRRSYGHWPAGGWSCAPAQLAAWPGAS